MTKINVYDVEAERLNDIAEECETTIAEVVCALFNLLDDNIELLGNDGILQSSSELLMEYM